MTAPTKINFKVYQGATFKEVLRWESSTKHYSPITAISKTAPISITAPNHGAPIGWRVLVTNVVGMKEINSSTTYHTVTTSTTDTLDINSINALAFTDYVSGGVVEYNEPVDLTGMTGRMQLRDKLSSDIVLLELTTENGGIIIDNTLKTITISISAVTTALLNFTQCVYSLELQNTSGEVFPFIYGNISLVLEVTR